MQVIVSITAPLLACQFLGTEIGALVPAFSPGVAGLTAASGTATDGFTAASPATLLDAFGDALAVALIAVAVRQALVPAAAPSAAPVAATTPAVAVAVAATTPAVAETIGNAVAVPATVGADFPTGC